MSDTIISSDIGEEGNGCIVVSLLSEAAQRQVYALQQKLASELDGVIWQPQPNTLHITLCEVIPIHHFEPNSHAFYREHRKEYETVLSDVLPEYTPIELTFDTIEVSPKAIIIKTRDSKVYNEIRSQLVERLSFPVNSKRPPAITHITIARFISEVELGDIEQTVSRHQVYIKEVVKEFQFMADVWPHLLQYDIVGRYPLISELD